jgi:hypothetical protein
MSTDSKKRHRLTVATKVSAASLNRQQLKQQCSAEMDKTKNEEMKEVQGKDLKVGKEVIKTKEGKDEKDMAQDLQLQDLQSKFDKITVDWKKRIEEEDGKNR